LLVNLPAGATVIDARLADAQARRLPVTILDDTSAVPYVALTTQQTGQQVFDLSGRPVGPWNTLPSGIYIVKANGKQYKVKK
jgi:hypothetical protein